jgi:hypothetical protein
VRELINSLGQCAGGFDLEFDRKRRVGQSPFGQQAIYFIVINHQDADFQRHCAILEIVIPFSTTADSKSSVVNYQVLVMETPFWL